MNYRSIYFSFTPETLVILASSFVFVSCPRILYTEFMIKKVLGVYIIWIICINLFAFYTLNRFNLNVDTAYTWINPQEFSQNRNLNLVDLRVHWDSFWYLKIAQNGYEYVPGKLSSITFFPLFPLLIWLISCIPLITPALAGWIISTTALGIGLVFLYKLVKRFHPDIDPLEPIILLLIFPTAFFLNSVYTESLFLALSIIFFYYLLQRKFVMAAIFVSLASLCKLNGLFLFAPFIFEYLKTYGLKRFFNVNLLSFAVAPLGILIFSVYQYIQFGEPLAFFRAQMEWGRNFTLNMDHFQLDTPASFTNLSTDLLFLALSLTAGILLLRYSKASYGVYVLFTTLAAISTGTLMSISRFTLILFPIFILAAFVKSRQFKFGWQLVSILLLAAYTILFVNNYWAG